MFQAYPSGHSPSSSVVGGSVVVTASSCVVGGSVVVTASSVVGVSGDVMT